jgi:hypothetical protein
MMDFHGVIHWEQVENAKRGACLLSEFDPSLQVALDLQSASAYSESVGSSEVLKGDPEVRTQERVALIKGRGIKFVLAVEIVQAQQVRPLAGFSKPAHEGKQGQAVRE